MDTYRFLDNSLTTHADVFAGFAAENRKEAAEWDDLDPNTAEWHRGHAAAYQLVADALEGIIKTAVDYREMEDNR